MAKWAAKSGPGSVWHSFLQFSYYYHQLLVHHLDKTLQVNFYLPASRTALPSGRIVSAHTAAKEALHDNRDQEYTFQRSDKQRSLLWELSCTTSGTQDDPDTALSYTMSGMFQKVRHLVSVLRAISSAGCLIFSLFCTL